MANQAEYDYDICGEETISIVLPTFLTLTTDYAADPTLPYTVLFDDATATEHDIMVHTFDYTVELNEYDGIVATITETATFEIACPDLVTSSSLDVLIEP